MIPSQSQAAMPPTSFNSSPFYSSTEFSPAAKTTQYMSPPYTASNRQTIYDRRQSLMAGQAKKNSLPNTPPNSDPRPPRIDYSTSNMQTQQQQQQQQSSFADEPQPQVNQNQTVTGTTAAATTWDQSEAQPAPPSLQDTHGRPLASYSSVQPNLPPLAEAIQGAIPQEHSQSIAMSPPMQATALSMGAVVASPPNFYASAPYLDMPAPPPVGVYSTQEAFDNDPTRMQCGGAQDHHSHHSQIPTMEDVVGANTGYDRRVSYPFASSLQTGPGMVATNMVPEPSNSSTFAHGGLVAAHVHDMTQQHAQQQSSMTYMNSMALPPHAQHPQPPVVGQHSQQHQHHHHHQPQQPTPWPQDGDVVSTDGSVNGSKVYSFVPLSGVNSKKRPRRRFDEIERLYVCNWGDCEKSYGTLNHLNAHVNMQKHGPKRLPA
ncbi:hypothetical protein BGZ83_008045, partial [Gryganskiella cystojenkinii]